MYTITGQETYTWCDREGDRDSVTDRETKIHCNRQGDIYILT